MKLKDTVISLFLLMLFGVGPSIWSANAKAQPSEIPPEGKVISVAVPCNQWQYIKYNLTNEFGEIPFSQSTAAMELKKGPALGGKVFQFVNPDTLSYTIVMRMGDEPSSLACIVLAGNKFMPPDDDDMLEMIGEIKL